MSMFKQKRNREDGIVSILTVLFLTILLSVLVVAFLRVMNDEQTQTIDDDLTKSAYSSALTGVEDAKRAIEFCYSLSGPDQTACFAALENPNCPGALKASTPLTNSGGPLRSDGQVGGDPSLSQKYTCMIISRVANNYLGEKLSDTPRLIELSPNTPSFQRVVIRWHNLDPEKNGFAHFYANAATQNPQEANWRPAAPSGATAVPMLRAQVYGFEAATNGGVELDDLNRATAAAYFVPTSSVPPTTPGALDNSTADWGFNAGARQRVNCTNNLSTNNGYSCEVTIRFAQALNSNKSDAIKDRYYLMLSSLYGETDFEVELQTDAGTKVSFYDAQTVVDVTGAASDVYRRIQARVEPDTGYIGDDALQSGASVCKGFFVTTQGNVLSGSAPSRLDKADSSVECSGLTLDSGKKYPVRD